MKRIFRSFLALSVLACAACSSVSMKDQVIARSDDLSSRPEWVKDSETFTVSKGTVYMLGSTTIPATSSPDRAYRIAENNAKQGLSSAIEQKLDFVFQNAEDGTEIGSDQTRFIGMEASKLVTSAIRPSNRYWEKVVTVTGANADDKAVVYRVYARVAMPEKEFKKAIERAIAKAQKKGLSADFAKKVDAQWDRFTAEE